LLHAQSDKVVTRQFSPIDAIVATLIKSKAVIPRFGLSVRECLSDNRPGCAGDVLQQHQEGRSVMFSKLKSGCGGRAITRMAIAFSVAFGMYGVSLTGAAAAKFQWRYYSVSPSFHP
jgi:hypothetical protein